MIEIIDAHRKSGSEWCTCCQKQANTKRIRFSQDGRQGTSVVLCDDCRKELIRALEQEHCEDCISRQTVKEQMIKYGFLAPDMTVTEFVEDELPPVTPERPKGEQANEVLNEVKSEVINIADGRRSLTVSVILRIISKVRAHFESRK